MSNDVGSWLTRIGHEVVGRWFSSVSDNASDLVRLQVPGGEGVCAQQRRESGKFGIGDPVEVS
jgi:hypothetical protein